MSERPEVTRWRGSAGAFGDGEAAADAAAVAGVLEAAMALVGGAAVAAPAAPEGDDAERWAAEAEGGGGAMGGRGLKRASESIASAFAR